MSYGLPYMGSKNRIVKDLFKILPNGKRFVDLFGGGACMSVYALQSGKYEEVLYNELDPLVVDYIKRAMSGDYDITHWVSREEFFEKKDTDSVIKYCWSFGNNGNDYLYGKNIEELKHKAHNLVCFGESCKELDFIDKALIMEKQDLKSRRLEFYRQIRERGKKFDLKRLERLQHLEHLEQLQHLEHLEHLEIRQGSYKDYEYKEGDVVYCDPPYEPIEGRKAHKGCYDYEFDYKGFYDWAMSREYQVYFSSHEISDDRFYKVKVKEIGRILSATGNGLKDTEYLYSNKEI